MQQADDLAELLQGLRSALPTLSLGMFTGYSEILVFLLVPARGVGAGPEEDVGVGNRIDRLAVEAGGGVLHCLEHERHRIALRPIPILGPSYSSQQQITR
jgi:hypothetical protein